MLAHLGDCKHPLVCWTIVGAEPGLQDSLGLSGLMTITSPTTFNLFDANTQGQPVARFGRHV